MIYNPNVTWIVRCISLFRYTLLVYLYSYSYTYHEWILGLKSKKTYKSKEKKFFFFVDGVVALSCLYYNPRVQSVYSPIHTHTDTTKHHYHRKEIQLWKFSTRNMEKYILNFNHYNENVSGLSHIDFLLIFFRSKFSVELHTHFSGGFVELLPSDAMYWLISFRCDSYRHLVLHRYTYRQQMKPKRSLCYI